MVVIVQASRELGSNSGLSGSSTAAEDAYWLIWWIVLYPLLQCLEKSGARPLQELPLELIEGRVVAGLGARQRIENAVVRYRQTRLRELQYHTRSGRYIYTHRPVDAHPPHAVNRVSP